MSNRIFLIGVGIAGLNDAGYMAIAQCDYIVASSRHRFLVPKDKEIIPIAPVKSALNDIERRLKISNVGVLASGDPLFFGIGRTLLEQFGSSQIEIIPALSSMQQAFSKFKIPWDDAVFFSLHGRELADIPSKIIQNDKVFLFTDRTNSPDMVCKELLKMLVNEKEFKVMVAEDLGSNQEKLTTGTPSEIAELRFSPLNIMIVLHKSPENKCLGLTSEEICHSRGLITKDEVRAITLHKLCLPREGVFWDIGAGSGSVSVEAAGISSNLSIISIEKKEEEIANIRSNINKFNRFQIEVVKGEAPESLNALSSPDRVFIGGSGGSLKNIIDLATSKLKKKGIIVVNAVLAETADKAPKYLADNGLTVDITEISIKRRNYQEVDGVSVAVNSSEVKYNTIYVIRGVKSE